MTSGGREVDVGEEGPNYQNNAQDHHASALLRFRTPDLSMMETTGLDR